MLEERGAEAIPAPTIRIAPPEDADALGRACEDASTFDWIVFTSANGVEYFMERLLATSDVRELKGALMNRLRREVGEQLVVAYQDVELPPRVVENEVDLKGVVDDLRRRMENVDDAFDVFRRAQAPLSSGAPEKKP